ncbi:hypothetical protein R5R35_009027 [Gryllus longicercus]|uniref:Uncharacterized protein n=1 Tax=Gryllus longicercus TaxID=2509291 RepID=A0AAN9VWK6_9ORTH
MRGERKKRKTTRRKRRKEGSFANEHGRVREQVGGSGDGSFRWSQPLVSKQGNDGCSGFPARTTLGEPGGRLCPASGKATPARTRSRFHFVDGRSPRPPARADRSDGWGDNTRTSGPTRRR